jgi:hypothetical protein
LLAVVRIFLSGKIQLGGPSRAFFGMTRNSSEIWSLCIGRWRGVEVRLHVLLPMMALTGLLATRSHIATPQVVAWGMLVLMASVTCHEVVRVVAASRVGGHADSIVLGPVGGWSKLHLPADPPAHIATSLAGPTTFFVLMVVAGCGLALAGDSNVLRLLNVCNPQIDRLAGTGVDTLGTNDSILSIVGQLTVWINCCLFLISLMPIDPCPGAELMRSVLWPIVGRTTAASLTSLAALGAAVFALVLAIVLPEATSSGIVPTWFPLSVAALFLLYGGSRTAHERRYDESLAIDMFDSDDEVWIGGDWIEEDREVVLVEHLPDKQQDAIDRKRREREANEDARVDAILARLNQISFDQLSDEDRAILKRASRRYRQRRAGEDES